MITLEDQLDQAEEAKVAAHRAVQNAQAILDHAIADAVRATDQYEQALSDFVRAPELALAA